jgi:hypothetical protein
MGLDISSYRKLSKLDCVFDADGEPINPITRDGMDYDLYAHLNSDFPGREGQIENKSIYSAEDSDGFRAGSYGFYNNWREDLAQLAGYAPVKVERYGNTSERHDEGAWLQENGPFWEMIVFSDCEGVIGAEVCAKLAKDFAEFEEKAKTFKGRVNQFYELYEKWKAAFEMGADEGAVQFH